MLSHHPLLLTIIVVYLIAVKTSVALTTGVLCSLKGSYHCDDETTGFFSCTLDGWIGHLSCGDGQQCTAAGIASILRALSDSSHGFVDQNPSSNPNVAPEGDKRVDESHTFIPVSSLALPTLYNSGIPSDDGACSASAAYACANDNPGDFYICGAALKWIGPLPCGTGTVCQFTGPNTIMCRLPGSNYPSPAIVAAAPAAQASSGSEASEVKGSSPKPSVLVGRSPTPVSDGGGNSGSGNGTHGKRIVGYFPNWTYWQTQVPLTVPDLYGPKLTHVNHAFASLAYSSSHDVWYVTPSDPQVDFFISVGNDNAASTTPNCLDMSAYTCGSEWNPSLPLVPYIGAAGNGSTCTITATDCWNPAGITMPPGRGTPCFADTVAYLRQGKYACGYVGYYSSQLKKTYPNIKVLLALGGWYDSNAFSSAVSPKYVDSTIAAIKAYINAFQFDGVDIDWEYPGYEHGQQPILPGATSGAGTPDDVIDCTVSTCAYSGRSQDGVYYVAFLQKLRAAMGDKLVTIAAPAGQDKLAKVDVKAVCDTVDFVNLMTYDMNGAWSAETNHQAPLYHKSPYQTSLEYSIDNSIKVFQQAGCDMSKITLGVPFYARVFSGVTKGAGPVHGLYQDHSHEGLPGGVLPSYAQIMSTAGWQQMTDFNAGGALAWNDGLSQLASFDNPSTIAMKAKYLQQQGLGGWMLWALGQDTSDGDLFNAMVAGLSS